MSSMQFENMRSLSIIREKKVQKEIVQGRNRIDRDLTIKKSTIDEKIEATFFVLKNRSDASDLVLIDQVINDAKSSFSKLSENGEKAILSPSEKLALEIVVIADGSRPAIRIKDGKLDPEGLPLGQWEELLNFKESLIISASKSVGRIEIPIYGDQWRMQGTGFPIAPNLIITNMHVVKKLASAIYREGQWNLNFFYDGKSRIRFGEKHFRIVKEVCIGPHPSPYTNSVSNMDFAVLEIADDEGFGFPKNFGVSSRDGLVENGELVFSLGYPSRPPAGDVAPEILERLFKFKFGVLRVSPGDVITTQGDHPIDIEDHLFTHNCTTLNGNSGSPIIRFSENEGDGISVAGLHFGGVYLENPINCAHPFSLILPHFPDGILEHNLS